MTTKQRVDGDYTVNLPVDRVGRVLSLQPGVASSSSGNTLFIRGGRGDENALYIDGVPAQAGGRSDVNSAQSSSRSTVGTSSNPGVNTVSVAGFEEASVTTGASAAEFGNAQSGIIAVQTRSGGSAWSGSLSYETDELFSSNNSYGINRVIGSISGPITSGLTFFLGGDIEGRQSAQPGQDRELNPIFVQAGAGHRDEACPARSVIHWRTRRMSRFRSWPCTPAKCDQFSGSSNPDISSNYGFDCRGVRLPGTTASSWRVKTNLNWNYGTGSRLKAQRHSAAGTDPQLRTHRIRCRSVDAGRTDIYTLNWTQNLSKSAERALGPRGRAVLSAGPLSFGRR